MFGRWHDSRLLLAFSAGAIASVAAGAWPALATGFDTTPSWDGSSSIAPFGSPQTATYGQTFVAPAGGDLQSFTFFPEGSATLQAQALVYAWSGSLLGGNSPQGAIGPALYASAPFTIAPTGGVFVPYTATTGGLALTPGASYIALFTVSGPDPSDAANSSGTDSWGLISSHVANNGGGGLNFDNNSTFSTLNNGQWDDFGDFGDLAWRATFTASLPEPASLAILSAGLIGLATVRRRKRS